MISRAPEMAYPSSTTVTVNAVRCYTAWKERGGVIMVEEAQGGDEARDVVVAMHACDQLHTRIGPFFHRREMRERVRRYVAGVLSQVERKNGWQLAEALGEAGPQGVQRLFTDADWDAEAVRDVLRAYVVEHLGDEPSGVLVIDETGFLKKGTKSAGVARQYRGTAGRRENQQIGVFLLYASARGAAFIDRTLYVPDEWVADATRHLEAQIPPAVAFATKGELARTLLARAFAAGGPPRPGGAGPRSNGDQLRRRPGGGSRSTFSGRSRGDAPSGRRHTQT